MEFKPLKNYSEPTTAQKSSKLAIVTWLAVNAALVLAIYFGLKMRGML
jgi:hypothetical protein